MASVAEDHGLFNSTLNRGIGGGMWDAYRV